MTVEDFPNLVILSLGGVGDGADIHFPRCS